MKSEIVEQLGQADLLLPSRIAEGLAANNRVKARLSILQAAAAHAQNPGGTRFDLAGECRADGIDPAAMEELVGRATRTANGRIAAPGLGTLLAAILDDVTTMARAVEAGDAAQGLSGLSRLSLLAGAASGAADEIEPTQIAKLTAISGGDGDSLHRLIMDLHKGLNKLAAGHAEEVVAGAHVYGLLPDDRAAVEAFMRGVEATQKLKFGHPGLATTAARAGTRLTIQNDIGETDAHVVVIAIDADAVTVTYTDVHLARAQFFAALFKSFAVEWSGLERKSVAGLADGGVFYLITGRHAIGGDNKRDAFLEALGASLVFLIDWNKARKLLRTNRVLGREAAVDFLKTVLRVSAEALLQGSSLRLARDRIEADFVRHLQRVDTALLAVVIRQAGLAREIGAAIACFLAEQSDSRRLDGVKLAASARRIEEKADRIAMEARGEIARLDTNRGIEGLVNHVEDAIDELEQAAFVASLIPAGLAGEVIGPLSGLCAAVISGTEAAAIGATAAAEVPEGHRINSEDALAAVGRLIDAEHDGDAAERKITSTVLTGDFDLKTALSVTELAGALERATDRLAAFGHALREYVLADLAA